MFFEEFEDRRDGTMFDEEMHITDLPPKEMEFLLHHVYGVHWEIAKNCRDPLGIQAPRVENMVDADGRILFTRRFYRGKYLKWVDGDITRRAIATYEKAAGDDPAEGNGEVKNYVGVKIVQAEPCIQDGREGYRVVYPDGYESWSPKGVFEAAYLCLGDDPTKISRETVIEFIGDNVWSETLEGGKTTLVKAKTLSGFEQIEASSCVDPSNYDEEIGVNCCMKRIEDTIWKCLGFVLQWGRDGLKRG